MKSLALSNVPDDVFQVIEEMAKQRGVSMEQETLEILRRWLAEERKEAVILAEARANREELSRKGIFLTDEDLKAAIEWGRE